MRAWVQAARPLAQVNIAVPLLLGQALAWASSGRFDAVLCMWIHIIGVLDHLFIVFANDVADEEADRLATPTPFSGGSRVLVEGKLTRAALTRGAMIMAAGMLAVMVYVALAHGRPWLIPGWLAAVAALWAYSFPPLWLSYRGHGEILQALGLGLGLPLMAFYVQAGALLTFPWPALAPLLLLGYASNITTALPDHDADASAHKRSPVVRLGEQRARKLSVQLIAVAALLTPLVLPDADRGIWLAVEAGPALALVGSLVVLRRADHGSGDVRLVVLNSAALNLCILGWIAALVLGA